MALKTILLIQIIHRRLLLLKGPSQPPPFSMPSKLLILHGEAKSEFFTTGCPPESMFNYL